MPALKQIQQLLDKKVKAYNCFDFIESDPISIPHRYSRKEDIEISGFLTATISWGQRKSILKSASHLMQLMDNSPWQFVKDASKADLSRLNAFVYRTFQNADCLYFVASLRNIYARHNGLESVFQKGYNDGNDIKSAIQYFRTVFFETGHQQRTEKHVANVVSNAAAKRINMFLRWMVRCDTAGVDFGLWQSIPPASLMIPLDVHTGNVARELEILKRNQNDWQAVEELMQVLRTFDANDPVKYDFALFGMGVNKQPASTKS